MPRAEPGAADTSRMGWTLAATTRAGPELTPTPLASAPPVHTSPVCPPARSVSHLEPGMTPQVTCANRLIFDHCLSVLKPGGIWRDVRAHTHTHTCARAFSHACTHMHTQVHTCAHSHTSACTFLHPHTQAHAHSHAAAPGTPTAPPGPPFSRHAGTDDRHLAEQGGGLTLRSLWTTPIWWQWRTASRICWMQ